MKKLLTLLAVFCLATAARAEDSVGIDMSATSPASASTVIGYTTKTNVAMFTTCDFYAILTGATGGALDVYIQTQFKTVNGTRWVDVAHFPQKAAASAATAYALTLTRWSPSSAVITASLNTVDGTPALAVNTVVPGILGNLLRVVFVAGASTSAGAVQTILAFCSGT